ncbi:DUF6998 domain-containing protein [Aliivibrio fischeri]|uniref:DUF6998 domain-containing protein n=1 Tax=Aliivibrio fischeri TaxID=668 RepID=UPI0012DA6C4E|nr:hypothetical protein [Aliivibrio fischeri]MUJ24942.1 hypothetical protein [Aliivibrio fischeri]
MANVKQIPEKIRKLYDIVNELEAMFPGRHFTPDGHLVGSIGEVLAEYHYGLELFPASVEIHDGKSPCGKLVQVKATQSKSIGLRSEPEHLLVLKILSSGSSEMIYNGPGKIAWAHAGKMQKNGQRALSVTKMRGLMLEIETRHQLPMVAV